MAMSPTGVAAAATMTHPKALRPAVRQTTSGIIPEVISRTPLIAVRAWISLTETPYARTAACGTRRKRTPMLMMAMQARTKVANEIVCVVDMFAYMLSIMVGYQYTLVALMILTLNTTVDALTWSCYSPVTSYTSPLAMANTCAQAVSSIRHFYDIK
jgi:hypothetical protein